MGDALSVFGILVVVRLLIVLSFWAFKFSSWFLIEANLITFGFTFFSTLKVLFF